VQAVTELFAEHFIDQSVSLHRRFARKSGTDYDNLEVCLRTDRHVVHRAFIDDFEDRRFETVLEFGLYPGLELHLDAVRLLRVDVEGTPEYCRQ
jgi:hypothetical protein